MHQLLIMFSLQGPHQQSTDVRVRVPARPHIGMCLLQKAAPISVAPQLGNSSGTLCHSPSRGQSLAKAAKVLTGPSNCCSGPYRTAVSHPPHATPLLPAHQKKPLNHNLLEQRHHISLAPALSSEWVPFAGTLSFCVSPSGTKKNRVSKGYSPIGEDSCWNVMVTS